MKAVWSNHLKGRKCLVQFMLVEKMILKSSREQQLLSTRDKLLFSTMVDTFTLWIAAVTVRT